MTRIISGFPGIGKSYAASKMNDPYNGVFIIDSDSSKHPKDNFPLNYIEHIYYTIHLSKPTILFVSCHEEVRRALVQMGIYFTIIYPERQLMGEYIQRYIDRGSPKQFINLVYANWDSWVTSCEGEVNCKHIVLRQGQYLIDVL